MRNRFLRSGYPAIHDVHSDVDNTDSFKEVNLIHHPIFWRLKFQGRVPKRLFSRYILFNFLRYFGTKSEERQYLRRKNPTQCLLFTWRISQDILMIMVNLWIEWSFECTSTWTSQLVQWKALSSSLEWGQGKIWKQSRMEWRGSKYTCNLELKTFSVSAVVSFSAQLMSIMVLAYVCTLSTPLWLLRFTAVTQNANLCVVKL